MIEASRFKEKTDLSLEKASRNSGEAKFIPLRMRSAGHTSKINRHPPAS